MSTVSALNKKADFYAKIRKGTACDRAFVA
jgi:hypothetical protein